MSDDLTAVEDWAAAFIARLEPGQRRALAGQLARDLRRRQQARIARQQDPDGGAFTPRKPQPKARLRDKAGSIRRGAMFKKLRLAKRLKIIEASAAEVGVGFTGNNARIARVHQEGLREKLGNRLVAYPQRRLLGFTADDSESLMEQLLAFLDTQ